MKTWALGLPPWAWAVLVIFVYVAVKAPTEALGLIAEAGRIIGAVGDGVIKILSTFHLKP
ncbi:MAG TPA: hypothetical protein VH307_16105 [Streptosporangiaceae bacterium]|jgi:hypothetical protein|nr:hypothetical protein [Streptosporangiaceae bacterium]